MDLGTLTSSGNAKPLLIVEDVSVLRLRMPIPESYSEAIPDTSAVEFTVEAAPGKNYFATNLEKRFVIRLRDGKAEWVDVKNGFSQNDKVEIFGSLNKRDLLLSGATDEIKPHFTSYECFSAPFKTALNTRIKLPPQIFRICSSS